MWLDYEPRKQLPVGILPSEIFALSGKATQAGQHWVWYRSADPTRDTMVLPFITIPTKLFLSSHEFYYCLAADVLVVGWCDGNTGHWRSDQYCHLITNRITTNDNNFAGVYDICPILTDKCAVFVTIVSGDWVHESSHDTVSRVPGQLGHKTRIARAQLSGYQKTLQCTWKGLSSRSKEKYFTFRDGKYLS